MSGPLDIKELYKKYRIPKKNIIHIGAADGRELDTYNHIGIPFVLWIEANPSVANHLKRRLEYLNNKMFTQNRLITALVLDRHAYTDFNITNKSACSSILPLGAHKRYYPDVKVVDTIKLHTRRMDEIIESELIDIENYNFLNIDVQGVELSVIKSFGDYLEHIDYIHTEVNIEELYKCCDMIWQLDNFLCSRGFIRLDTSMTDSGWGDAFYIST